MTTELGSHLTTALQGGHIQPRDCWISGGTSLPPLPQVAEEASLAPGEQPNLP